MALKRKLCKVYNYEYNKKTMWFRVNELQVLTRQYIIIIYNNFINVKSVTCTGVSEYT